MKAFDPMLTIEIKTNTLRKKACFVANVRRIRLNLWSIWCLFLLGVTMSHY